VRPSIAAIRCGQDPVCASASAQLGVVASENAPKEFGRTCGLLVANPLLLLRQYREEPVQGFVGDMGLEVQCRFIHER